MKNLKSKGKLKILQKNEPDEENYFSKKVILNTPNDILKVPIDQLKKLNIYNLSGEFYQKIYDEAVDVENGKKTLKDFNLHFCTPLPQMSKKSSLTSNQKKIRNKSTSKKNSQPKVTAIPKKARTVNIENITIHKRDKVEFKSSGSLDNNNTNTITTKNKIIETPKVPKKKSFLQKLIFLIKYDTTYGESIGIIGSSKELGNWDVNGLIQFKWNKGNLWTGEIDVNENNLEDFEFKFVILNNGQVKSWENGSNNKINYVQLLEQIKNKSTGKYNKFEYSYFEEGAELTLKCRWNK